LPSVARVARRSRRRTRAARASTMNRHAEGAFARCNRSTCQSRRGWHCRRSESRSVPPKCHRSRATCSALHCHPRLRRLGLPPPRYGRLRHPHHRATGLALRCRPRRLRLGPRQDISIAAAFFTANIPPASASLTLRGTHPGGLTRS
jgi:hypothetical protein